MQKFPDDKDYDHVYQLCNFSAKGGSASGGQSITNYPL